MRAEKTTKPNAEKGGAAIPLAQRIESPRFAREAMFHVKHLATPASLSWLRRLLTAITGKTTMRTIIAAASLAALFASPAAAQDSAAALADAFIAAVEAEDAAALGALYTDDADSYGPDGSIAKGSEAIGQSWAPMFEAYDEIAMTLEPMGERAFGKDAHAAWGLWTMSMTPAGGGDRMTIKGRYSDVSIKTKDGWRYIVDHASMMAEETATE